jgi:hypothetical protein
MDHVHDPPGSKPIELVIGTMVETAEKAVTTLSLAEDLSSVDTAALKAELATLYNVPASSITLSASAGSTILAIQIAESPGLALSDITAAMSAATDSALTSALGASVTTTVAPASQLVVGEVQCQPGYWCSAGDSIPCGNGTYNSLYDQHSQAACDQCPRNSFTPSIASTSLNDCMCDLGHFQILTTLAENVDDPDNPGGLTGFPGRVVSPLTFGIECIPCMIGTNCSQIDGVWINPDDPRWEDANLPSPGYSLQNLPVKHGYWRTNLNSTDVKRCPDERMNCSTTAGTWRCQTTSGCRGTSCAPGLTGAFCQLCESSGSFYVAATVDAIAHCAECGGTLAATLGFAGGVLAALPFLVLILLRMKRMLVEKKPALVSRAAYFNDIFKPANKLKIMIGFYMIATKVDNVYEVELPADVKKFLARLSGWITLGVRGVETTPLECMGLSGHVPRLLFWILVPPVVIVIVVAGNMAARAWSKRRNGAAPDGTLFEQSLPLVLKAMFLAYPVVTQVAFESFPCYEFDNRLYRYLKADVNIDCNTSAYAGATGLAWVAIILYPIGLLVLNFALLVRCRKSLLAGEETPLTRATAFLHKEYDPICFWWELAEMLRRFLLVGLFVVIQPGQIMQICAGTIVAGIFLLIQLQAKPYKNPSDDLLASASSFALLMVFLCSIFYKYASLIDSEELQAKMSDEQREDYITSSLALSVILIVSVLGSILAAAVLAAVQVAQEIRKRMALRLLKYAKDGKEVVCKRLTDAQAFHLFLSHAWPAAQDRMRIVKERFGECLPSARVFLDVDDLKSGSGTAEVDKSECILVFTTTSYFCKKNSMKELYRAVVQRRPILAMLEPDTTQEGGLTQAAITEMLTSEQLDGVKFEWLKKQHGKWAKEGALAPDAFDHAPSGAEVAASLFAVNPVEWNRLPHFQDVTIRLIAERGILHSEAGKLYMQGEVSSIKVALKPPTYDHHLYVSPHNAGAKELAEELARSDVLDAKGKQQKVELSFTSNLGSRDRCDHMLVLLDDRTWTSGETTAAFIQELESGMAAGIHMLCVHEFPSVVGPPRHECEFALMFRSDWTPDHLQSGETNLYREIALALKGAEWRTPGLVALASKIAGSSATHQAGHSTEPVIVKDEQAGQGQEAAQGDLNA